MVCSIMVLFYYGTEQGLIRKLKMSSINTDLKTDVYI